VPKLILALFVSLLAAGSAAAEDPTSPACAAYQRGWDRAVAAGDTVKMGSLISQIPDSCPAKPADRRDLTLARKAEEARKAREEQEARDAEQAREDRQAEQAREDQQAEQARQAAQQRAAEQARDNQNANAAPEPAYRVHVCNKSSKKAFFSINYQPVGETQRWRHRGWWTVEAGACLYLFDTDNPHFVMRAESATDST